MVNAGSGGDDVHDISNATKEIKTFYFSQPEFDQTQAFFFFPYIFSIQTALSQTT